MGKVVYFVTLLVMMDLLFIATGQVCAGSTCSLGSIVFNAIFQIGDATFSQLFRELIGNVLDFASSGLGMAALLGTGAVIVGAFVATKSDTVLFIPITLSLSILTADFVVIATYLLSINKVLGLFVMAPIMIIYILVVPEWLRGRD